MYKILCIWCTLGVFLISVSCSKSQESLVEQEFEKYVSENFDDPNALKEILSVEVKDTITKIDLIALFAYSDALDSLIDKHQNILNEKIWEAPKKLEEYKEITENLSNYERKKLLNSCMNCVLSSTRLTLLDNEKYWKAKRTADSALNEIHDFEVVKYEIRTRIKEKEELRLKTYFCLFYGSKFIFFDEDPNALDYPEIPDDVLEKYSTYLNLQKQKKELLKELESNVKEAREMFEDYCLYIY